MLIRLYKRFGCDAKGIINDRTEASRFRKQLDILPPGEDPEHISLRRTVDAHVDDRETDHIALRRTFDAPHEHNSTPIPFELIHE